MEDFHLELLQTEGHVVTPHLLGHHLVFVVKVSRLHISSSSSVITSGEAIIGTEPIVDPVKHHEVYREGVTRPLASWGDFSRRKQVANEGVLENKIPGCHCADMHRLDRFIVPVQVNRVVKVIIETCL
jgi:hypothetical protein